MRTVLPRATAGCLITSAARALGSMTPSSTRIRSSIGASDPPLQRQMSSGSSRGPLQGSRQRRAFPPRATFLSCCPPISSRQSLPSSRRAPVRLPSSLRPISQHPVRVRDTHHPRSPRVADLFAASRVSRAWRDAAMTSYAQRVVIVPTTAGALFQAAAQAEPGATLRLVPGMHHLSSELTVDRPLRILSDRETERVLGTWAAPSACAARRQRRGDDVVAAGASDSDEAVIVLMASGVVRTLCSTLISDVTLCRMGDPPVRYPNAVACAETGCLRMERCRVTCGGHATSVPEALQIFADAPAPGDVWSAPPGRPGGGDGDGSVSAGADAHGTPQPQAGVWVGAAASVELHGCMIVSCPGPGVKVYRGRLLAQGNTIAFSSSANVVVNGGHVVLEGNEIRGARGDGVASYNACQIRMHHNTVHSNRGYGVKLNLVAAQSSRMDPVLNPQTAHELQELNSVWHNAEGQVYGRPPH